jgi:hypothetical protein
MFLKQEAGDRRPLPLPQTPPQPLRVPGRKGRPAHLSSPSGWVRNVTGEEVGAGLPRPYEFLKIRSYELSTS